MNWWVFRTEILGVGHIPAAAQAPWGVSRPRPTGIILNTKLLPGAVLLLPVNTSPAPNADAPPLMISTRWTRLYASRLLSGRPRSLGSGLSHGPAEAPTRLMLVAYIISD